MGWAPDPMTAEFTRKEDRKRPQRRKGHVVTEAENGVMRLQAQEPWDRGHLQKLKGPGRILP